MIHRPTWVEVDLDAIRHNVEYLTSLAPGSRMMAVVKANAYGHGAVPVARAAVAAGAAWLGVAILEEGLELREAGLEVPILVLGHLLPDQIPAAVAAGLSLTVSGPESLPTLRKMARAGSVRVHLKIDTGMARLGVRAGEAVALARALLAAGVNLEGVFTHFAAADDDPEFTRHQWEIFTASLAELEAAGVRPPLGHAANSAALLNLPPTRELELFRAGIALYGLSPATSPLSSLSPALRWLSRVTYVKRVAAGTSLGYGRSYRVPEEQTVATVGVGYADGYRRLLSNRAQVLLGGQRAAVVGRVSMDQILVAVPAGHTVRVGDPVVLMGADGEDRIPAEEMAAWLGTIDYEVVTGIGARVPRIYRRGGELSTAEL